MKSDNDTSDVIQGQVLPWQQSLVDQLLNLKSENRLPHALLIEIRSAADCLEFGWHLVSALLCLSTQQQKPCGHCAACHAMQANSYPDFSFTTLLENERTHKPNKDIKIDQIRQLIHRMSLTNSLPGGKIALIYPAEKMNQSSSNALLKTLEEPSADALLILLTHNAGRLPVTIRSRCQHWVVANPNPQEAAEWLADNGVPRQEIDSYLDLAQQDAQLAAALFQQQTKQQYDRFTELLEKYRSDQIDVISMAQGLKTLAPPTLRLILKLVVQKSIYRSLQRPLTESIQHSLVSSLDQLAQQERLLSIEDNNLNLQLQLEDVLISLKQILNLNP